MYSKKDIRTLESIEAVRTRPGMYIGSVGIEGVHHITLEIISNAIDEYLNGYGKTLEITIGEDDSISILDSGRGIPWGLAEDGSETLENIFTKLHTGAKFNADGKTGYNSSGGLNGVGAKAANGLSDYFKVRTVRNGEYAIIEFEKGKKKKFKVFKNSDKLPTGSLITFLPDKTIFKSGISLDQKLLRNQIQELSYLCPGLKISFKYKKSPKEVFLSQNGTKDFIEDIVPKNKRITSIFSTNTSEKDYSVEVSFVYTSSTNDNIKLYTNNIPNSAGTHLTGYKSASTRVINEVARKIDLLKEKDENLTGEDLKEGLCLILSLKMREPVFNGQTKEVLTSSEARKMVESLLTNELRHWLERNPKDLKNIVEKAILSKKARLAAKKAREVTRLKSKSRLSSMLQGTLSDCSTRDLDKRELFLVEGKSAAGSAKGARDRECQAILPIQGKIINTLKNDISKSLNNKEVQAIVQAIGAGFGPSFNIDKSRYKKIILLCDADVDGSHIILLLLTLFYFHMRPLVEQGYVYLATPPLYRVSNGKTFEYLSDDSALEEYKQKNSNKKFDISYFKGLGEMDSDELKTTTMDINNRRLKQLIVKNKKELIQTFEDLLGDSAEPRKEFLTKYGDQAKVSI